MTDAATNQPAFQIQRIYVRDCSFEAPNTPEVFLAEWKPDVSIDLQTKVRAIEADLSEVVLVLTVSVKNAETIAFCVEVHQAGLFTVMNFPADQKGHALGSLCPSILYPYAREAISNLVMKGGFPQLLLAPVNFDALYFQHLERDGQPEVETKAPLEELAEA